MTQPLSPSDPSGRSGPAGASESTGPSVGLDPAASADGAVESPRLAQPSAVSSTRDIVFVSLFAALIAILGLIPKIDLPFLAGVPITVQTLGVMLAGLFLGPRRGALAVALLVFVVLLGAPFLSGGRGGLGVLFGPTAGFLIGWIPGALFVGLVFFLLQRLAPTKVLINAFMASVVGGIVVIYSVGIPVLAWRAAMPIDQAVAVSLAFIPGDLLKAAIASALIARFPSRERLFG
ncbi:MAG: biotin transporter BioY [Burkholderiaceae bacterium]